MSFSVKKKVFQRIEAGKKGQIYFAEDFIDIANNEQIRLALSRLTKEGNLIRLGHGIYVYPKTDPLLGKVRPSLADIAQAIAPGIVRRNSAAGRQKGVAAQGTSKNLT